MKFITLIQSTKPFLFALLGAAMTGLLLALSALPLGLDFLAWVAFLPLFFCIRGHRLLTVFILSFFSGALYYALAFHWLQAFHVYAIPVITMASALFFFALPIICIKFFFRKPSFLPLIIPSIWVVFESIKQTWFLRFPFGVIGYTQYSRIHLIQIADLGGVEAVSWVILFVNSALFLSLIYFFPGKKQPSKTRTGLVWILTVFLCLLSVNLYGVAALRSLRFEKSPSLKIGFAQTLFHPRKIWATHQEEYLQSIEDLAESFTGLGTDLILFPELTIDRPLTLDQTIQIESNAEIFNTLSSLAKKIDSAVLFGSLELKRNEDRIKTFNSMYLFNMKGDMAGIYRKRILVPFGETNPFPTLIPSLSRYLQETTDSIELMRGTTSNLIDIETREGNFLRLGILICFEGTLGAPARDYALKGADFLVNATNDYWSLSSNAMYQHAVMSIFRAIETRTPVLRISNGGYSCYVDERGIYASTLSVFSTGSMTSKLYLLENKPTTVYIRFGSWFIYLCILLIFVSLVRFLLNQNKSIF